jgi:hypothetical protein
MLCVVCVEFCAGGYDWETMKPNGRGKMEYKKFVINDMQTLQNHALL